MRALLLTTLILVSACGGARQDTAPIGTVVAPSAPIVVTDDRGKTFTFKTTPARVVTLAPSATETIFALGLGSRIIATDDFSDFPAEAKALPKVGGFRSSPERIISHTPDVIFAISSGDLALQLDALGWPVVILDPLGIDGVYRNIELIGTTLGRSNEAEALVSSMRQRISVVAEKAKRAPTKPRVMHEIDATDPLRVSVAGPKSFIDEIITTVGGANIVPATSTKYPRLSPEEIVRSDPEIIVLGDVRYGVTPDQVRARAGYANLTAVRTGRLLPIDDDIVSRPGPRLVLGVEAYAKLVHPEVFGTP